MPRYQVTAPDGRVVTLEGDSPPTDADLDEIFASLPPAQTADPTAMQVAGEFAAGVNESLMFIPDTLTQGAVGGLHGLAELIQGNGLDAAVTAIREAPTISDAIRLVGGQAPGDPVMEPSNLQRGARTAGQLAGAAVGFKAVPGRDLTRATDAAAVLRWLWLCRTCHGSWAGVG